MVIQLTHHLLDIGSVTTRSRNNSTGALHETVRNDYYKSELEQTAV